MAADQAVALPAAGSTHPAGRGGVVEGRRQPGGVVEAGRCRGGGGAAAAAAEWRRGGGGGVAATVLVSAGSPAAGIAA